MFREMQRAGYMARSQEQRREHDGTLSGYVYIVGADPSAVKLEASGLGVAFLPQTALPCTAKPSTGEPCTADPPPYKRKKNRKQSINKIPPSPTTAIALVVRDETLHGEVLSPDEGEIAFDDFWKAIREGGGPVGPAIAAWHKLSEVDRRAIANLIGPQGLALDGMWACTWLTARRWASSPLLRRTPSIPIAARPKVVELKANTPEWNAERARMVAAGESVKLMDAWGLQGRSWSCYAIEPTA